MERKGTAVAPSQILAEHWRNGCSSSRSTIKPRVYFINKLVGLLSNNLLLVECGFTSGFLSVWTPNCEFVDLAKWKVVLYKKSVEKNSSCISHDSNCYIIFKLGFIPRKCTSPLLHRSWRISQSNNTQNTSYIIGCHNINTTKG